MNEERKTTPLSVQEMNERAKALYEAGTTGSAPRWEHLGDVTKSVWIDRVYEQLATP